MPLPSELARNQAILSEKEWRLACRLCEIGQDHLFRSWPAPGESDADKRRLLRQAIALDEGYPEGLAAYVGNARRLLAASRLGSNPYEGFLTRVPAGVDLRSGGAEILAAEELGMAEAGRLAFVLVAGGLGERLGYRGIKVALPVETTTGKPYLCYYIEFILALERRARAGRLPLAIMTSEDTHALTAHFLEENNHFGMAEGQITLLKQEQVPSLLDNQARFATSPKDPFHIATKPHGHGDVHALLHKHGLARRWVAEGRRWLFFFQDTNALVFNALPAALGVSAREKLEVNSIAVPRSPGEAAGALVRLEHPDGRSLLINVEYNQLDGLLRSATGRGDEPGGDGRSPYPGNINALLFALEPYARTLDHSGGATPEFVNPKYADDRREVFKSPARLECMMQDYPLLLGPEARTGFTLFERSLCFSAVKNNFDEAAGRARKGLPPEGAASAEFDFYAANRWRLEQAGMRFAPAVPIPAAEAAIPSGTRAVLAPSFAPSLGELRRKVLGGNVSTRSSLVVEGEDILIENLDLDGDLEVRAISGARAVLHNLAIRNAGSEIAPLAPGETAATEIAMRGFRILKKASRRIEATRPGLHEFSA